MFFSLYHTCILYWLACITVSSVFGIFSLQEVGRSEAIVGLVHFGKLRKGHNFGKWLSMIEVPKRWFWVFYLIALISVLFAFIDVIQRHDNLALISMGLLLYLTHVTRRLYECLYVSIFSDSNMNLLHFLLGCTFYPLCVCSQLSSFTLKKKAEVNTSYVLVSAVLTFIILVTQLLQHHCFVLLAQLRPRFNANNIHAVPRGGLFEYCLSPHYFLEIILYFLLALFYQFSLPMLLCFLFVTVNQTVAALLNRNWYEKHFPEYSNNRKTLVPYIF